ncbi:MAG: glycosyltransferase family 4 protein, partial [Planctomycetes bacterium]|nr:glycosyltransferase family 4 protein [Planctomycetota bacterium]
LEQIAHFAEIKNEEDRIDLYRAADLVCIPSRNDPFSVLVPEAWAAGKPVVVTQSGGPGEYVWHEVNGLHVHAAPDSVAWGINHCFRDFEWARWIGRNGRVAAETAFTWSHSVRQTEVLYQQVINHKNSNFQVEAAMNGGKVSL